MAGALADRVFVVPALPPSVLLVNDGVSWSLVVHVFPEHVANPDSEPGSAKAAAVAKLRAEFGDVSLTWTRGTGNSYFGYFVDSDQPTT